MKDNFTSYSDYKKSLNTANKGATKKKRSSGKSKGAARPSPLQEKKETRKPTKKLKKKVRKIDRAEEKKAKKLEKQERKEKRIKERRDRTAALASKMRSMSKKIAMVLMLLVIIAEMLLMLNLNSKLDAIQFEINDHNEKLGEKKQLVKELNSEKEAAHKSETIENLARYKLGMVYPTKEQTIYINLD
ncbi:MAG: hypothetical protein Q4A75_03835 [Peptostreptococcaceae bacterium]|nr:hypothetical protein [Peptostreptococcaceae bacterium]